MAESGAKQQLLQSQGSSYHLVIGSIFSNLEIVFIVCKEHGKKVINFFPVIFYNY